MLGPSFLADGPSAVTLMGLHLVVGLVLIAGFGAFVGHREHSLSPSYR